jgi:hypothetical protein
LKFVRGDRFSDPIKVISSTQFASPSSARDHFNAGANCAEQPFGLDQKEPYPELKWPNQKIQ